MSSEYMGFLTPSGFHEAREIEAGLLLLNRRAESGSHLTKLRTSDESQSRIVLTTRDSTRFFLWDQIKPGARIILRSYCSSCGSWIRDPRRENN